MTAIPLQRQTQADNAALHEQLAEQASAIHEVEKILYYACAPLGTLVERVRFIVSLLEYKV